MDGTWSSDVDRFVVCDPRRNKLISSDGEKTDAIDAGDLAALLRGGYLREIYHTEDENLLALKDAIAIYHDRVREAVRQINKLRGGKRLYLPDICPTGHMYYNIRV